MPTWIVLLAAAQEEEPSVFVQFLIGWGPVLFIAFLLYFAVFRKLRLGSHSELVQRSHRHMDTIEAKADEMIGLLREINEKLSK